MYVHQIELRLFDKVRLCLDSCTTEHDIDQKQIEGKMVGRMWLYK